MKNREVSRFEADIYRLFFQNETKLLPYFLNTGVMNTKKTTTILKC